MRRNFILPIALCALLGAAATAPAVAGNSPYTTAIAVQAEPSRVVQIAIDRSFTLHERAKILRAVNEWNTVLNGQVRLEISANDYDATTGAPPRTRAWTVARIDSRNPMVGSAAMKRTLAMTFGTTTATVFVVADRIGSRDLTGIMMHEFGHALGAGHDSGSELMNPYYTGNKQGCIDKGAVVAVSSSQRLVLDGLNWCGGGTPADARTAESDHKAQAIKTRARR